MSNTKLIQINLRAARELVRVLSRAEEKQCIGCAGDFHEAECPSREILQLRNYLTQRVNNPTKNYGI
jgi:hypothetical protein